VEGVEGERDEDEGPLEDADQGEGVEQTDLLGVGERAVECLDVGEDVLDQERANGDDAGERVQLAPEEGVAEVWAERLDSAHGRMRGGGRGGCCHGSCSCGCLPVECAQADCECAHNMAANDYFAW